MRKISKTRAVGRQGYAVDIELGDTRPRRVPGATITSWPGSIDLDLTMVLANPRDGATIDGGTKPTVPVSEDKNLNNTTVALSDGTRITFVTASNMKLIETV
jgi:hypothetical protein